MNGTIQKKKDSLSNSQGFLFVFEWSVVIKSIDEGIASIA